MVNDLMPFQNLPFNGDTFICKEFLKLKEEYSINVAVETGSCLYSTTAWLGENFDKVFTVEINYEFAKRGIDKVLHLPNVSTEINNSVEFLKNIKLNETDRPIYFLDAHWGQHCPLMDELVIITQIKTLPPVITIHDFYTENEKFGWDEYNGQRFDWEWIKSKIDLLKEAHSCDYKYYFNTEAQGAMRGIIYIVPLPL